MRQDESSYYGTLTVRLMNLEFFSVENREPLKVCELGKDLRKVEFKKEVVSRIDKVTMKEEGRAFKGSCGHPGKGWY